MFFVIISFTRFIINNVFFLFVSMYNVNHLSKNNIHYILISLFSIISIASLSTISNSNAVSTNADLNNVFNCITQKANARQDLVLSDAFICYDHNLKGASKFANKPFQNPDLSNLGIKPTALSTTNTPNTAADKATGSSSDKTDSKKNPSTDSTTDNTLTKTNSKTTTAADKPTADTTGAHDNQGITDSTGNHKKDTKSSTASDPFTKAAGDSSTSSSSKTQPNKGKPDINPTSKDFQSFDLPFSVIIPE